jgi:hypothetical protein
VFGRIGRTRIDGSGKPDPDFIVGASEPCGLSIYGHHLYWVNESTAGSIGRANLTGPLDVHENFVPSEQGSGREDLNQPCGVAVNQAGIYWTNAVDGGVGARQHRSLSNPGVLVIRAALGSPRGVREARVIVRRSGTSTILLHPTPGARLQLSKQRQVKAHLRIAYTPTGGITTTRPSCCF